MNFVVIARFMIPGETCKNYQREFGSIEAAEAWAQEMYNGARDGEEVTVLLYELKKSYN